MYFSLTPTNHMKVTLVSYSQPTPELCDLGTQTAEDLVAYCARVSNPQNQLNNHTAKKLIRYLVAHKHWSPLEMVTCCLEITTTRDIARQILRHRSFSFQEFSQRYADPLQELDEAFQLRECRLQDTNNRQNSIALDLSNPEHKYLHLEWQRLQQRVLHNIKQEYRWAIEHGIAKEQARAILPEGLTISKLYMQGTLRSWIHYIELRSANGTQLEHQHIAQQVAKVISEIFPLANEFVE